MKTQHTPGPWFIERRTYDNETTYYGVTASDGHGWSGNRYMSVSGCIDEHDARLIAAAPELLEALRDLLEQTGLDGWRAEKARDAIAKATKELRVTDERTRHSWS